jgi:ABC-type transport system involved in cytochrome bd biosynthesis fused ATPase/permease subunit
VCQANRELIRVFFGKRAQSHSLHRGLFDGPFLGMDATMMTAAATAATIAANPPSTPSKHASKPSMSGAALLAAANAAAAPLTPQQSLLSASLQRFHIALVGAAGAGKTSTAHNITGRPVPIKHAETSGMQLLDLTWPYKVSSTPRARLLLCG